MERNASPCLFDVKKLGKEMDKWLLLALKFQSMCPCLLPGSSTSENRPTLRGTEEGDRPQRAQDADYRGFSQHSTAGPLWKWVSSTDHINPFVTKQSSTWGLSKTPLWWLLEYGHESVCLCLELLSPWNKLGCEYWEHSLTASEAQLFYWNVP